MAATTSPRAAPSVPVSTPITRGIRGSGRFRSLVEQALGSELSLEPLQAHEQVSCADPLDRRGPEDELSALLPEVEVPARLDALPVEELESRSRRSDGAASAPAARRRSVP